MNPFINYVKKFGNLSSESLDLLFKILKQQNFIANEYFLSAGEYSNKIGFIEEGVFRIIFYNKEGDEITRVLKNYQFFSTLRITSAAFIL